MVPRSDHRGKKIFGSAREAAVHADAPLESHRLLDAAGVPAVTVEESTRWAVWVIKSGCVNGLAYLIEAQPEKMKDAFSQGAVAGLFVAHYWVTEGGKSPAKAERARQMLMTAQRLGATWVGTDRFLATEAPQRSEEFRNALREAKASVEGEHWAIVLPGGQAEEPEISVAPAAARRRM